MTTSLDGEATGRFLSIPECEKAIELYYQLNRDCKGNARTRLQLRGMGCLYYYCNQHGPFDFETQNQTVEAKIEAAMKNFDYAAAGYALDTTPGRVFYFYHNCTRYWKYIRPVQAI